jgi:PD-(D/E)XK nuclease superfamily protein
MSPRNTRTGGVLEGMILPALDLGGYTYRVHAKIGQRVGLGSHIVDVLAKKADIEIPISLKWQQVSGTAEQKVPFEVICLMDALEAETIYGTFAKAYVVLGGEGWTLRNFYTSGGLLRYINHSGKVEIVTLEAFVGRANSGGL